MNEREIFEILKVAAAREIRAWVPLFVTFRFSAGTTRRRA